MVKHAHIIEFCVVIRRISGVAMSCVLIRVMKVL